MSKIFEVHITGEKGINAELDEMNIKNIVIDLLNPDFSVLRTEYMSSYVVNAPDYFTCKQMVDEVVNKLKSKIIRLKIESPVYPEYVENSLYLETHFKQKEGWCYPLSRNRKSGKVMGTHRTYKKSQYNVLTEMWKGEGEVEICLYDDYIREDFDWFKKYEK